MIDKILQKHFDNISTILEKTGEHIEGNLICDVSSKNIKIDSNKEKIKNIQKICRNKKKICEIGVNAGHSLLLMLNENPHAEYFLFDNNYHGYTEICLNYIKSAYPKTKINIIFGNSQITLPKFLIKNPEEINSFDFIHIDGGHDNQTVLSDFMNTIKMINENGICIFDDYNYHNIETILKYYINHNLISPITDSICETKLHLVYERIKW